MNARLRKLKDGTGRIDRGKDVVWFDSLVVYPGKMPQRVREDFGEIYWPFVLVWETGTSQYTITHLPSGYAVTHRSKALTRRQAIALVRQLRALGDWQFTKPTSPKWHAIKGAAHQAIQAAVQRAQSAKYDQSVEAGAAPPQP